MTSLRCQDKIYLDLKVHLSENPNLCKYIPEVVTYDRVPAKAGPDYLGNLIG